LEGHFLSDSPRFQQINPVLCGYYTESESDGDKRETKKAARSPRKRVKHEKAAEVA